MLLLLLVELKRLAERDRYRWNKKWLLPKNSIMALMELLVYFPSKQSKTRDFIGHNFPRNYLDSGAVPPTCLLRGGVIGPFSFGLEQQSENRGDSCNEVHVNSLLRALRRRSTRRKRDC